jgi:hypothetical protein
MSTAHHGRCPARRRALLPTIEFYADLTPFQRRSTRDSQQRGYSLPRSKKRAPTAGTRRRLLSGCALNKRRDCHIRRAILEDDCSVRRWIARAWIAACVLSACAPARTPDHFLLPDGFTGWVYVRYDDPSCAPLDMRDGRRVVRIPADGRLCTSTTYETGSARDLYEYIRPDGTTRPLDNAEISLGAFHEPGHYESFRVGPGGPPDLSPFR